MWLIDGFALGVIVTLQATAWMISYRHDDLRRKIEVAAQEMIAEIGRNAAAQNQPQISEGQLLGWQLEMAKQTCLQAYMQHGLTIEQANAEFERRRKAALH